MQANVLATVWPLNAKFSMPTKLALPVERPWSVVDTSQQLPALKKAKHYNSFSRYYKLSIWIYLDLSGSIWSTFCTSQQCLLRTACTWGPMRELPKVLSSASRLKIPRPQGGNFVRDAHLCCSKTFEHLFLFSSANASRTVNVAPRISSFKSVWKLWHALTAPASKLSKLLIIYRNTATIQLHYILYTYMIIHIIVHNYVNYVLASCNSCNIMWLYHVTPKHHLSWYTKEMCRRRLSGDIAS